MKNRAGAITSRVWLIASFVFLYIPILTLVILSFNASPMVTNWGGFSLRWYGELMRDEALLSGLWLSLKIAVLTAISSVLLGTLAALALVKIKSFPGKTFFSGMVNSPLVMPEVIIGLSLLLLLVSMQRATGFPERGLLTIWIGHTLLCMAYATVVISARLREMDVALEDAAKDLGAQPLQVFFLITLPLISQSMISAGLLTFTLSLDDVVLSAFLSGPGTTTMPIVIFSRARLGLNPTVNAVATITVLVVGTVVVLASLWIARQERRRSLEQSLALRSTS